jgi:hypothetical protein
MRLLSTLPPGIKENELVQYFSNPLIFFTIFGLAVLFLLSDLLNSILFLFFRIIQLYCNQNFVSRHWSEGEDH